MIVCQDAVPLSRAPQILLVMLPDNPQVPAIQGPLMLTTIEELKSRILPAPLCAPSLCAYPAYAAAVPRSRRGVRGAAQGSHGKCLRQNPFKPFGRLPACWQDSRQTPFPVVLFMFGPSGSQVDWSCRTVVGGWLNTEYVATCTMHGFRCICFSQARPDLDTLIASGRLVGGFLPGSKLYRHANLGIVLEA